MTALSTDLIEVLENVGFRCRPESWNRVEISSGQRCDKLVFAPPAGERATNVHIRLANGPNARYALLFRDYLRADETARKSWGAFEQPLSRSALAERRNASTEDSANGRGSRMASSTAVAVGLVTRTPRTSTSSLGWRVQ